MVIEVVIEWFNILDLGSCVRFRQLDGFPCLRKILQLDLIKTFIIIPHAPELSR